MPMSRDFQPGDLVIVRGSYEGGKIRPDYRGTIRSIMPSGTLVVDDADEKDGAGTPRMHYVMVNDRGPRKGATIDPTPSSLHRPNIRQRLEYLRGEIQAERISYGEIAELQSLAEHIAPDDVELLEWAGVPEHEQDR